ncbi:MAG: glycoside hydrolase family 97 protein [Niabella sp.]
MKYRFFKMLVAIMILCAAVNAVAQKSYTVTSPNGEISVLVSVSDSIRWQLKNQREWLVNDAVAGLDIAGKKFVGYGEKVTSAKTTKVDKAIVADIPVKSKLIRDEYNELTLKFRSGNALVFRVYNNGAAYRWATAFKDSVEVNHELVNLRFPQDNRVFWGGEANREYISHFELQFKDTVLSAYGTEEHCGLPLYVETSKGSRMLISESDLYDYPNLFLFGTKGAAVTGNFPKVILQSELKGDRGIKILKKAPYIARTAGNRNFPWRVIMVANDDKELLVNNLIYQLASPNILEETAWIKPGKVAWDWYNANNIYGVNFRSGINNETYKYYIDFAAKFGLNYIILDEGWSRTTWDLTHSTDSIDVPGLVSYGKPKNVGVILWALWEPMDKNMQDILDTYVKWGVKGIKVDFMQRADQYMVNFYERLTTEAAKRKLLVDLHGSYKPVGLNRKYPNLLSFEGVKGLENYKWSDEQVTPLHDVILPFTRMVVGPMDYTPGAMRNAIKKDFHISFTSPMSQGTRAHQVAMYVIYESPLQMLADNPSNYMQEPDCTAFMAQMPTVWDTTIALQGKIGEYVAIARKKGNKWYVGAMTNWTPRDLKLSLDFLQKGKSYKANVFADGVNADKYAQDYSITTESFTGGDTIPAKLKPGGGWCAIIQE